MNIEDFNDEEDHEGIPYKVNGDGTTGIAGQMNMDEVDETGNEGDLLDLI